MQTQQILQEIGAQIESYYFTDKEIQELTKTSSDRKIVTKLPPIFTVFKEKDFLQLPDNTDNFLATFDFENLESALYEQAENFLCGSDAYDFSNPIYNRKLNQNKLIKNNKTIKDLKVYGLPQYIPQDLSDLTLGFESRFECGNLSQVYKIKDHDYELFVDNDVNNQKYTNWFFFRIYNVRSNIKYKFTINNLNKSKNLYNKGQKLLVYSCKHQKYYRMGEEIIFYSNFVKKKNNLYCKALSFKMEFQDDYDTIYIMQNYPYTFTRVRSLTNYLIRSYSKNYKIEKINIGQTLCNNNLDVLRICTNNSEGKKAIVIGARVHPAETISSWVMERVLIQLLNPLNIIGKEIINKYDVHILPMINIDGVTLGNYRTNLSGYDLNRTYIEPKQDLQPTTYYYKKYIANLKDTKDVYFFLDIHCHSKKFNCFIYANPVPIGQKNPYISLMEQNIDFFSTKDCLYSVSKEKEKSARVVMWKQLQIEHSYTLEMSYAGISQGVLKNQHHSNPSVNQMARGILQSLLNLEEEEQKQQVMLQQQELVKVQLIDDQQQVSQRSIDSQKNQLNFYQQNFIQKPTIKNFNYLQIIKMNTPLLMDNTQQHPIDKDKQQLYQINWTNIDLKIDIKKEGKEKQLHILKDVSGYAKSGETLSILGSSGAGKSTLLNILSGRFEVQKNMILKGQVNVNNEDMNWNRFKMICGFVMQTDIFLEFLTVKEIFEYTAKLIYKDASQQQIQDIVNQVIKCLKLEMAQDNIVGGNVKGISGGEKRRLNIGCELLKNPKILFLDEPTSGLDSYTAYIIARTLKQLAVQQNILVVYTIHQPSEAIQEIFDRVMILEAGEVVVFDEYKNILKSFKQLEIDVPKDQNLLEYSIELCKNQEKRNQLIQYYKNSNDGEQYVKKTIDESPSYKIDKVVDKPSLIFQTQVLTKRNFFDYIRNPKTFKVRFIQIIFTGLLFLLLYWQQADVSATNPTSIMNRLGALFFVSTNLFMLYANTSLAVLCFEKTILAKEYQNGLYGVVPYFIAKVLVEFPLLALYQILFASIIYFGANFENSFKRYGIFTLGCILESWLGTGVALMLSSAATSWEFAVQISPLIFVPAIFFSGFTINLNNIYFLLRYLQYISPVRYIFELFVYNEFEDKTELLKEINPMKNLGFTFGIQKILIIVLGYFLICLTLGLMFLKFRMKMVTN